jgi:predicted ATP-grasp superfamily ATP-dependent carboligase
MITNSFARERTVFVLSLFDTGLAAVRALGRVGIPVIGLESDARMPGFKSRYCMAKKGPDPIREPDALLAFLLREAKKISRPGILFPASDAYVLFVSRHRERLGEFFDFVLPPAEVVETILNKRAQYEFAARAGLNIPQTFFPETRADLECIKNELSYPAFIKPYYGHLWREKFGGTSKGVRVESADELIENFENVWAQKLQALVQTVIAGPPTNNFEISFYINLRGAVAQYFTVRKRRQYPPEFGVGTMVETLHCPELLTLTRQLLKGLDYRGFGNLEFKLDARDGALKLIELNARLWQQTDQAEACGLNFPLLQYLDVTGQPLPPQRDFADSVKWVDPLEDFQSFWHYYRRGELSPRVWLQSWRGAKAFAVFARDDLRPGLAALEYGKKIVRMPLYALRHRSGN